MAANLADVAQSWVMAPDGSFDRGRSPDEAAFSCHRFFMENPSLSGRGSKGAADVPDARALGPIDLTLTRAAARHLLTPRQDPAMTMADDDAICGPVRGAPAGPRTAALRGAGADAARRRDRRRLELGALRGLRRRGALSPAYFYNEKIMCALGAGLSRDRAAQPRGAGAGAGRALPLRALARGMDVSPLMAVATAAVREAEDGPAFVEEVERRTRHRARRHPRRRGGAALGAGGAAGLAGRLRARLRHRRLVDGAGRPRATGGSGGA